MSWLQSRSDPRPATVALLLESLDPHRPEVLKVDLPVWISFAQKGAKELNPRDLRRSMAFVLTVGLQNPGRGADTLVACAFESVHEALVTGELSDQAWRDLKPELPELFWLTNWDKAERLRRALVNSFLQHSWSHEAFLQAVKGKMKTLRPTLEYCAQNARGRRFLRELKAKIKAGKVTATKKQLSVLKEYV